MCINTSESLEAQTILFSILIMIFFLAASAMGMQQTERKKLPAVMVTD